MERSRRLWRGRNRQPSCRRATPSTDNFDLFSIFGEFRGTEMIAKNTSSVFCSVEFARGWIFSGLWDMWGEFERPSRCCFSCISCFIGVLSDENALKSISSVFCLVEFVCEWILNVFLDICGKFERPPRLCFFLTFVFYWCFIRQKRFKNIFSIFCYWSLLVEG